MFGALSTALGSIGAIGSAISAYAANRAATTSRGVQNDVSNWFGQYADTIGRASAQTSAQNLAYAQQQQNWAANQAAIANNFNASQAASQRDWLVYAARHAHQWEIEDLKAAGLNPVLSAMGGNGASVGSGATANAVMPSGDSAKADSQTNALVSMLGSAFNAMTQIANQAVSARTAETVADKYTSMSGLIAEMENLTKRWQTEYTTTANMSIAEHQQAVQKLAAQLQYAASKYGADMSSKTSLQIAENQLAWQTEHPNNMWQELNGLINSVLPDGSSRDSIFDGLFDYLRPGKNSDGTYTFKRDGRYKNPTYGVRG